MAAQDSDFEARAKRIGGKAKHNQPMHNRQRVVDDSFDEKALSGAILLPQLAFVLGAIALILGRSVAMNTLGIEPSTDLLGFAEGAIVLFMMFIIALLVGRSNWIAHGAMVIGASLAFLGEGFFIPMAPELMESIYNPDYVALVMLAAQ